MRAVGRLAAIRGDVAQCSGGLGSLVTNADLKQARLLTRIDAYVAANGLEAEVDDADRPAATTIAVATHQARSPWLVHDRLGRAGTARRTRGSTLLRSTAAGGSRTTAASAGSRACSCWANRCCAAAGPI